MVKVSVIIPVYNAEEFLDESINSVLNQTMDDIELVCVNDGSKDNSLKMLYDFSKKDKRVKVIDKENGGCGSARNKALDNATGDYVYFFDPDDYILENTFEKLYENAIKNDSDLVMFKIARFRDGEPINYSIPGFEFEKIFKNVDFDNFTFNYHDIKSYVLNASFAPWTKLYKKSFLDSYEDFRFDLNVAFDDVPFHVKSLLRASKISYVPEFFYRYRLSNANSVNNTASNGLDIFRICDLVENFLRKNGFYDEFTKEFILFKITQVLNYIISSHSEQYFNKAKEEFNKINEIYFENYSFDKTFIPHNLLSKFMNVIEAESLKMYILNSKMNELNDTVDRISNEKNQLINKNNHLKEENNKLRQYDNDISNINSLDKDIEELMNIQSNTKKYLNWKISNCKELKASISIILPSYNSGECIDKCIKSVVNQTLNNIEIICVDAGSTDNTLDVIKKYQKMDSRIKLIHSKQKSYGHQMNLALEIATGEYIGIVETDDYVKKDMFETLYSLTENSTVDISKVNFWHCDYSNPKNPDCFEDGTKKNLPVDTFTVYDDANFLNGHPCIWAAIYRREFLKENNIKFLEAKAGGWVDNPFLFETAILAKSIKYKDEPYYYYYETNPDSSTNNLTDLNLPMRRMHNIIDILEKYECRNENVLKAFYTRIFWHIRDVFKKDNFNKEKYEVCLNIQKVLERLNPDIVKKYFSIDDQKLFNKCLKFLNKNPNILLIASDNNKTSGAFLSMANLAYYLKNKYKANVHIILPMNGHGIEVLNSLNLNYSIIPSKDWVVPLSKVRNDEYQKEVDYKKKINNEAVNKLCEYIKNNNIDIIHINTTYSYIGALAGQKTNTPVVWHLREFLEEDQSNTLWDRTKGNELINKSERVIAISDSIYNKYSSVIDQSRLVRIYNGIDAKRFYKPKKNILNSAKVKLIMVGGFEYYKGQIEFSEACVKVYKEGYSNIEIIFVGLGREDVQNEVKEIFKKAGMTHIVKYLGYKYDVENYFETSDISFTCAKSEAFGRTTVEAMLSGNLLIGADTAGTKELIEDNKTGILYKHGDTDDLSNKIIYAITNRNEAKTIALNGREYMYNTMTAEINADNIFNLYQDILFEKFALN